MFVWKSPVLKISKVFKTNAELIDWIRKAPTKKVNVLATYTALLDLRKDFAKEGYLKGRDERMKLRICHLYGNLMNTYGDNGNLLMLQHRAKN